MLLLFYGFFVTIFEKIPSSEANVNRDFVKNGTIITNNPRHSVDLYQDMLNPYKYYYVNNALKGNWYDALKFCRLQDMHLFSLDSTGELRVLPHIVQRATNAPVGKFKYWSSCTCWTSDKLCTWMSIGRFASKDFFRDKASCDGIAADSDERCFRFEYESITSPKLTLGHCNTDLAYAICETVMHSKGILRIKNVQNIIRKTTLLSKDPSGLFVILFGWNILIGIALSLMSITEVLLGDAYSCNVWIFLVILEVLCVLEPT